MSFADKIKTNVSMPDNTQKKHGLLKNDSLVPKNILRSDLVKLIENTNLDKNTKAEMLKKLAKHPSNTLRHFYMNFNKHIEQAQQTRKNLE